MFCEAESLNSRNYCESCFACLTAYLSYLCFDTHYEKVSGYMYYTCLSSQAMYTWKNNFISQKKLWDCIKLYIKINFYFRFHVLNLKICVWLWFFLDIEKDRKVRSRAEPDCLCPKRSHVGGSSGAGTENSKWGTLGLYIYNHQDENLYCIQGNIHPNFIFTLFALVVSRQI